MLSFIFVGRKVLTSVPGTGPVEGVLGRTTIGVHGNKVEGTVETAGQVGNVNIEGELIVEQVEHLVAVLGARLHEIDTATDVSAVGVVGDELQVQRAAAGGNTVRARVVSAIDTAVLSAGSAIRAVGGVPFVAGVAVGDGGAGGVSPSPVGVKDDTGLNVGTGVASRAPLPSQRRVSLSSGRACLLGRNGRDEGGNRRDLAVHGDDWSSEEVLPEIIDTL